MRRVANDACVLSRHHASLEPKIGIHEYQARLAMGGADQHDHKHGGALSRMAGPAMVGYYNPKLDATVVVLVMVMVNSDIARNNQNPAPAVFERLAAVLGAPIN
jgi:hypothetical protein